MADSVVTFVLDHLSELVAREANLLYGVEDRIQSLQNELQMINDLLNTSKSKKGIENTVVNQIRDVAHLAEDVIDTFVAKVAIYKRRTILGRMLRGFGQARLLHHVADKIDKIKTTLNEIRDNKDKYDAFKESNNQSAEEEEKEKERVQSLHELRRNVEEEGVVGFVHDSKVVIKRLLGGGSKRNVVSIIGMGGLGKTTLARKVYNNSQVEQHFTCRAWVYVSNECRVRELLLGLLKHLMPNFEQQCKDKKKGKKSTRASSNLSEEELKKLVRNKLESRRYLVVVDDLWKRQDWDEVQDAFPDNNRGSRILITSRLKEVALHTSHDLPYYLQFLSEEESWELFCRKVFRGEDYPSDLEALGKQMVQSCRGLPLSIIVLAGLLTYKEKSYREWSKVVGHVNWYLTQDETQVKDIVLKLSYDNLPRRLKPCFLYLGIFPEDIEIPVMPLLQKWVAEGFIQDTGNRDPDDVAEDYLYELIDRSLVQVAKLETNGGLKMCQVHDLLRDLCISESKKDKVFEVSTDNKILIPTKARRLSIHSKMDHYISSSNNDHSCISSLFFLGPIYYVRETDWKWLSKGFKLVRVLEFGLSGCDKIPSNLGNFINLRQGISLIRKGTFPNLKRIGLRLAFGCEGELPKLLQSLQQLSHLNKLEIFLRDKIDRSVEKSVDESVERNNGFKKQELLQNLGQLNCLSVLSIVNALDLLTHEIAFPPNITELTLSEIDCITDEGMNGLENHTKLKILRLSGNVFYDRDSFDLNCVGGSFPQLEVFEMEFLKLEKWKLDNGAMSRLQRVIINDCERLDDLPHELWSLSGLRKVQVMKPSEKMANMLRNLEINDGIQIVTEDRQPQMEWMDSLDSIDLAILNMNYTSETEEIYYSE
uniref:Uncharacterized protein n=1 Tax=Phaseolus vulgaris TaxID=3885 RepID=V7ADX4_PHAVU|nr:hypothetical protein PHAVU_011G014500g [Phaseolus vulgaris]ESW03445.1 hypothetical protein PHAVU_011G014500g [Phaseolus vulgaris]